jgi:hypothetical protein
MKTLRLALFNILSAENYNENSIFLRMLMSYLLRIIMKTLRLALLRALLRALYIDQNYIPKMCRPRVTEADSILTVY